MEEDAGTEYVREVVRTPVFEEGEIGELVVDGKEVIFRVLVVDGCDGPLYKWIILGALDGRVDDVLGGCWTPPRREEEPASTRHATQLGSPNGDCEEEHSPVCKLDERMAVWRRHRCSRPKQWRGGWLQRGQTN